MAGCLWEDCPLQAMYGTVYCVAHGMKAREETARGLAEIEVFKTRHADFDRWLVDHHLPREAEA